MIYLVGYKNTRCLEHRVVVGVVLGMAVALYAPVNCLELVRTTQGNSRAHMRWGSVSADIFLFP